MRDMPSWQSWYNRGTIIVQSWYNHGTIMVQSWYNRGTIIVQSWYNHGAIHPMTFATRRGHNSRLPEVAAGWNSMYQVSNGQGCALLRSGISHISQNEFV